ncbi:glycine zipper family protein [Pacificoceanicola onchidii]|uniref:glycine zipper family protein n=1 Tax=Pacificoceanicola onchidii TaxID=2562685 RepID=UPI0010A67D27|nr:glycine zipper family protein [Pacificoceanicola onchidii]
MKWLLTLTTALSLAACGDKGAKYNPILDGPRTAGYQADLADCQALANSQKQLNRETLGAAAVGAGAGATLGALDDEGDMWGGAVAGALAGGAAGAVDANERRKAMVIECLKGRGHPVVG